MGSRNPLRTRILRLIGALLLGPATCLIVDYIGSRFPYSEQRDHVTDAFSMPGGLFAAIFYPQGIHSGGGAIGYAYVALAANWVFYAAVWYVLLKLADRLMRSAWGHYE